MKIKFLYRELTVDDCLEYKDKLELVLGNTYLLEQGGACIVSCLCKHDHSGCYMYM